MREYPLHSPINHGRVIKSSTAEGERDVQKALAIRRQDQEGERRKGLTEPFETHCNL